MYNGQWVVGGKVDKSGFNGRGNSAITVTVPTTGVALYDSYYARATQLPLCVCEGETSLFVLRLCTTVSNPKLAS